MAQNCRRLPQHWAPESRWYPIRIGATRGGARAESETDPAGCYAARAPNHGDRQITDREKCRRHIRELKSCRWPPPASHTLRRTRRANSAVGRRLRFPALSRGLTGDRPGRPARRRFASTRADCLACAPSAALLTSLRMSPRWRRRVVTAACRLLAPKTREPILERAHSRRARSSRASTATATTAPSSG